MKARVWNLFALLSVLFTVFAPAIASAQVHCPYATIEDEVGTLDVEKVCGAAKPWSEKGIELYVLFSSQSFDSEDDWYAYLDTKEIAIGARDGDSVLKTFLAMEITQDASWAAITEGDVVYYDTPFDGKVENVKGILRNGVRGGDPTQAFVDALNEGYDIAYPVVPTPQPQIQKDPIVVVVTPQATREPVDLKPVVNGVKTLFVWILILGGGFALITLVIVPGAKMGLEFYRKYQHLSVIRTRTTKLLNSLGRLFEGSDVDAMLLFQLLRGYGIEKYPKANAEVREWLRRSRAALDEGFRLWKMLESDQGKKQSVDQQIRAWETLYLTLVGSNPDVLVLSDQQIAQLLDPSAGVEVAIEDVQLVEQLRVISKEMASGGYKIAFMLVKPANVDQEGILGYVKQVKDQLAELRRAKAEAAPKVAKAQEERGQADQGPFPGELTAGQTFAKADGLIAEAQADLAAQLWLPAVRKAEDAIELIEVGSQALPKIIEAEAALNTAISGFQDNELLPGKDELFEYPTGFLTASLRELVENDYTQATDYAEDLLEALASLNTIIEALIVNHTAHQGRMTTVDGIAAREFRLSFYQQLTGEVKYDIAQVGKELVEGDYQQANAMVEELTRDSEALLNQAQALVVLHNRNLAELQRLATEVARIEDYRTAQADPAWQTLITYPQGNRDGVADISLPTRTLEDLFDDPADEADLASQIARMNSMQEQQFEKAREELVSAFARLREAENQLKAIVERLEDVREAEAEAQHVLQLARQDLATADSKRDAHDSYIDAAVDGKIAQAEKLLTQAEQAINARLFLQASTLLAKARELSRLAAASADEQTQRIIRLLSRLESLRGSVSGKVRRVATDYHNQIPVLQSVSAGAKVNRATDALRQAGKADERLAGREDHELARAIESAIGYYEAATEATQEAESQMTSDKSDYDRYYRSAESAVSSASSAISSARSTMGDSDAGSAGESAYRRAQQYLPGSPSYGESVSQLQQTERQAEQARQAAQQAKREAQDHIDAVEAERARRRREEEERKRREEAERRRRESYSSSSSSFGSSHSSSSWGSSSRPSSSSSSHRSSSRSSSHRSSSRSSSHRSSSMGGSRRR